MGLMDKVKDVANKATEQAKHGIAVGKEKVDEVRVRKQIDETLQQIGDLVLKQRRGTAPADVDVQIDGLVAKIADLEAQLETTATDAPAADAPTADAPPAGG